LTIAESDNTPKTAVNDVVGKLTVSADVSVGAGIAGSVEVGSDLLTSSVADGTSGPSEIGLTPSVGIGSGAAISNTFDASFTAETSIVKDVLGLIGIESNADKQVE